MPTQKAPKSFVEPEQVFDVERQAHFNAQKKQANAMTNIVAQKLALRILAVKEKKRKPAAAYAERQNKKKKNQFS